MLTVGMTYLADQGLSALIRSPLKAWHLCKRPIAVSRLQGQPNKHLQGLFSAFCVQQHIRDNLSEPAEDGRVTMLASRDQENLIYTHQTTAAGKPLNQAIRGLQPKTPGNRVPKTPFRVALNDENKPLAPNGQNTGFKPIAKGNENTLQTTQKDGKSDNGVFVTPIGKYETHICLTWEAHHRF
jgi:hypothetical protein